MNRPCFAPVEMNGQSRGGFVICLIVNTLPNGPLLVFCMSSGKSITGTTLVL